MSTLEDAAEKPAMDNPVLQEIADIFHAMFCTLNHTDYCGYYYETWETANRSGSRHWDYERAEALLQAVGGKEPVALLVVKLVYKAKTGREWGVK